MSSGALVRAANFANALGALYIAGTVIHRFVSVPPPVEYQPGASFIPGWENMGAYDAVYGDPVLFTMTPGQGLSNGEVIGELTLVPPYAVSYHAFHSLLSSFTYWPNFTPDWIPPGMWANTSPAATTLLERHELNVHYAGLLSWRWGSRNTLWRKVDPKAPFPQLTKLPGRWVPRLPLGQPLPAPLAEPGFPNPFPRPRRAPRLRRRQRLDRMPSVEIDLGTGSRPITLRPGREQPPGRTTREVKMRGGGAIASLVFRGWEAAQDWTDWIGIVSNHSKAPASVRRGSPIDQLRWWRANPDQLMYVDWNEVAWSLLQWRIDESVGALQGKLMQRSGRNFGWMTHMEPTQAVRNPAGQSIGQAVTSRLRDGVSFALDF